MTASPRPAATIMVLRDGDHGLEVLMVRRSQKSSFFPHAWVFPGGRVDPADQQTATRGTIAGLSDENRAFAVAAIRECFEEAGVWLGEGSSTPALRDALNSRTATLLDAPDLVADLDRIEQWSRWITPVNEPKRYDACFFITTLRPDEANQGANAHHDDIETVDSVWIRPVDALNDSDCFLAPPTFITLHELASFPTAASAMDAAATRHVQPIMPVHSRDDAERLVIALPGDPLHEQSGPVGLARRVVLVDGRWVIDPLSAMTS